MNDLTTTAKAVYAHLNFKITDKLMLTAGARYTDEQWDALDTIVPCDRVFVPCEAVN